MSVTDVSNDERRLWLGVLAAALHGHGYETHFTDVGDLTVTQPNEPEPRAEVACRPRASDGGRLWFTTVAGHPLAVAEHTQIMNAITELKGLLAR